MRIVTFNILNGRSPVDGRVDVDRFAAAVRRLEPDVLALQEVDRGQERSGHADLTAVAAEVMGAVEHRFVAALAGTPGATWVAATGEEQPDVATYGVALLSRCPLEWGQVMRLAALPVRVPLLVDSRRRLVMVRDEPRVAVTAAVDSPLGPLTVVATHLSFLPGWNLRQLRRLAHALPRGEPLLLMGDLNMATGPAARATGLRPAGAALTFPVEAPTRQIDHILTAGLPPVRRLAAVATELSDHRALVAEW